MAPRIVHVCRLLLFAIVIGLIHVTHQRVVRQQANAESWSDQLPVLQEFLPGADRMIAASDGARLNSVVDSDGGLCGYVAKTLPAAQHIVGFSGPTDILLIFNPQQELVTARIINSRDTPDHVRLVREDARFLPELRGRTSAQLQHPVPADAVTGATLTSLAILESIRLCLSDAGSAENTAVGSLKFPEPPRMADVQLLLPEAARVDRIPGTDLHWTVRNQAGHTIGELLRTSPAADNIVGYQGPTDSLAAFDASGRLAGIAVGASFDNEPYVTYVRDDRFFRSLFDDRTLQQLADTDPDAEVIEGVSGATMTSTAIARQLIAAAQHSVAQAGRRSEAAVVSQASWLRLPVLNVRNVSTSLLVCCGVVLGMSRWRGRRRLRILWQLLLIVWLGALNGDLVSLALLTGWAAAGIPWPNAAGLVLLSLAALSLPVLTGHNVYCAHLCPHGAVQQLLRKRVRFQLRLPGRVRRVLRAVPAVLLLACVAITVLDWPLSLVSLEPFDAWVLRAAGAATLAIAIVGLSASLLVPMAYCRFGCPTGALLNYLRRAPAGRFGLQDLLAVCAVVVALSAWRYTGR